MASLHRGERDVSQASLDPPPSVVEGVIDGTDDVAVDAAFLAEAEVGVTPSPDAIEEHAVG